MGKKREERGYNKHGKSKYYANEARTNARTSSGGGKKQNLGANNRKIKRTKRGFGAEGGAGGGAFNFGESHRTAPLIGG